MSEARSALLEFLETIVRPGERIQDVDDAVNLFDSGFLDSLAVVQIISYLEQGYGIRMAGPGIDPTELGTIGGILGIIASAAR